MCEITSSIEISKDVRTRSLFSELINFELCLWRFMLFLHVNEILRLARRLCVALEQRWPSKQFKIFDAWNGPVIGDLINSTLLVRWSHVSRPVWEQAFDKSQGIRPLGWLNRQTPGSSSFSLPLRWCSLIIWEETSSETLQLCIRNSRTMFWDDTWE